MLNIIDIHTYYGDSYVLQGVSLEVKKGSVVALLGRNGVGKTTLVRSIVGFTPARRGRILFNDRDITHMNPHKIIRLGVGLVPQGRRVFPSLTVKENLAVAQRGRNEQGWGFAKIYSLFPRLEERRKQRASTLSGGEQQMLAVARALISNPLFILMDEPTEGLAPVLVREVGEAIRRLKEEGLSIFLVEQNLAFARKFADRIHLMSKGKIVCSASPEQFWEDSESKHLYLGV
ncbi:MAG: ABC transporter ATP-binding protein [Desulfobacteraceae bacterium]|nr:MAG: ABC transporter ATP-binding protein [Desulfobacteraceae bacterium]